MVFCILALARVQQRLSGWQFGLRLTRFWPSVGLMALAWFCFLLFSAIWVQLIGVDQRTDLPDRLGADRGATYLIMIGVLLTVIAPIVEELFFRGYFFTALRNWRGLWPAVLITGAVFGAVHIGSAQAALLLPLAVFGGLLCLLYWRTGSLYPCIVLHSLNNSLAFGISQDWGWQIPLVMFGAIVLIGLVLLPFLPERQLRARRLHSY
jgi:membrane protease YdiL (CAAX protease family)